MFDEQNRDVEFIPHKTDGLHQFGSLIGVHTSRRLVQQQQLGIRCQRSGDLQLALLSVGQAGGRLPRFSVQIEDLQQLHCLFIHGPLLHKIGGQTQNSRGRGVFHLVMQAHLHVVQHRHILEQTDILKCSCNTCFVDVNRLLTCNILAIQFDNSLIWLIHTCQKVEYRCFTGSVRSDQSVKFPFFDLHFKPVYCTQSSEGNGQIFYI